ncbi:flagellin N-terminal helical domain-containing protein, partial [Vibrio penaeicida]
MGMTVNTNVSAMTAQRHLNNATSDLNLSMERLSSGFKINSAKDDAAGLQISNRLNVQSRGLDVAVRNAND